jgi:hypothetical protein
VHLIHSITCLLFSTVTTPIFLTTATASLHSVQHLGSDTTPDKPKKHAVVGLIEIVTTLSR